MTLTGTIDKVTYHNAQNGYTVALFRISQNDYTNLHKSQNLISNRICVVGSFDRQPLTDEEFTLEGQFVKNPTYGLQFKIDSFNRQNNDSIEAIVNYLSSDFFPGIGPKTAKAIVTKWQDQSIKKIQTDDNCLKGLGISQKNQDLIFQTVRQNKKQEDIILYFLSHGLTMTVCHKILTNMGENAVDLVKDNPYILMEKIDYFGFIKNDDFALRSGTKPDSPKRIQALLLYILRELIQSSGNSYIEKSELISATTKFLKDHPVSIDQIDDNLQNLSMNKKIVMTKDNLIFDYYLYMAEISLAKDLANRLKNQNTVKSFTQDEVLEAYEKIAQHYPIILSPLQQQAVISAYTQPFSIITGGPGTGKSTIVNFILEMYTHLHPRKIPSNVIAILAPTGRAAKRLKEITNFEAQTIHKFLGYLGEKRFTYGPDNHRSEEFVIIDEASMMDLPLAYQLFSSLEKKTRIIIVGDVDQLPSVGPGQILKDLIDSKEITTTRLKQIHRQMDGSQIINLAHDINNGQVSDNIRSNFEDRSMIETSEEQLTDKIKQIIKRLSDTRDVIRDVQILAPMYRCPNGINQINQIVQELLNPANGPEIKHYGQVYRVNDKVIQLVNRSEKGVMNGDIGIINNFVYKENELSGVDVMFDTGKVEYTIEEMDDLNHAYAISVHKSQGSEFQTVIIPLTTNYQYMFRRKLIYTAITRAKRHLILVGNLTALYNGINRIEPIRKTILKSKINSFLQDAETPIDDLMIPFTTISNTDNVSPYDFENPQTQVSKASASSKDDSNDELDIYSLEPLTVNSTTQKSNNSTKMLNKNFNSNDPQTILQPGSKQFIDNDSNEYGLEFDEVDLDDF